MTVPRTRSRKWPWLLVGSAVLALGAAGFFAVTLIRNPLHVEVGRRHLREIPISLSACPSVESIHSAATRFQLVYTRAVFGFDTQLGRPTWPELQTQVDHEANIFDSTIESGLPAFPRALRRQLGAVQNSLAEGRHRLTSVTDPNQLDNMTEGLFNVGQLHFGYASDLVGNQCSVPLRADNSSSLFQQGPVTTTVQTAAANG